ncbi:MAG: NAD(P)H-dependent D-xylose reductase (XR) [Phylliscum demangeonii]|nr:MAG: NAD(P)H-dependent D-xylose reductase (XR) [Phylliscum demangeonii]
MSQSPLHPSFKMNNGREMPMVGFGLWKVTKDVCADQVYHALKIGYRLLDGACDYGNEVEAGQGLARAIKEGIVKRTEVFITSKLWNSFHDRERVEPICKKQLADWGIEHFDLYLMHFPIALAYVDPGVRYPPGFAFDGKSDIRPSNATIQETWQAMEGLVTGGLASSIGISNFQGSLILDLLRYATVRPAVLQIEHHPYLVQPELLRLAAAEHIAVTAYSSFGPQSFRELNWQKAHDTPPLFANEVIVRIAHAHHKTPAQVLLRWATQRGICVIPKSNDPDRLRQNLDVAGFELAEREIADISGLDRRLRFNDPLDYLGTFPIFA